jgi:hypothetical protein
MTEGFTAELVLVAMVMGALCLLIAMRHLSPFSATLLTVVRISIPLVYFAYYFDGEWCILDDLVYYTDADQILQEGFNPLTALFTSDGYHLLTAYCSGHHVLYTWLNIVAQYLFGPYYYANVFMNVVFTFVSAHVFSRTLGEMGFEARYRRWAEVFLLLHWDTIAWSSFINLKVIFVKMLTIIAAHAAIAYFRRRKTRHLLTFLGVSIVFFWIRFYVPFLLGAAFIGWIISQWQDPKRHLLSVGIGVLVYLALPFLPQREEAVTVGSLLYGAVRFSLTPLPWSVLPMYSYLTIPSMLHFLFALPVLFAAHGLWRSSKGARLWLIYTGVLILFYAFADELQGPRQRYQIDHIFAWAQFHFLWHMRPARSVATPRVTTIHPQLARRTVGRAA